MTADGASGMAVYADLKDRPVFVSGGASGIGAAIVRAFAAQGSKVGFVDVDTSAGAELALRVAEETGNEPLFEGCDVTDIDGYQAALRRFASIGGGLGVLVNNAARDLRVKTADVTPGKWYDLVDVNLTHQFFAAQAAHPIMAAGGGGSIINFGSIAPIQGIPDLAVYSTCKAAATGLTRSLARDFGADKIRVNTIVPGAILTPRQLRDWISEEDKAAIIDRQCLKRPLNEQDVAEMALFLASDASRGCTGQEFRVDGGNF